MAKDPQDKTLVVSPGPRRGSVRDASGAVLEIPEGWALLEPGDAGLTRKVKAGGASWTVKEKKGRRMFSRGVWAPAQRIERARATVDARRATPEYARKMAADKRRRDTKQAEYVVEFRRHVQAFLAFDGVHDEVEKAMAQAIAEHATPVGSGTVARTERIPVAERAEAATIAWMRHQTTGYDRMHIPSVKGRRKEVRRQLAARSRELLKGYRTGQPAVADCPLQAALKALADRPEPAERPSAASTRVPRRAPAKRTRPAAAPSRVPRRAPTPVADQGAATDAQTERELRQAKVRARFAKKRR